VNKLWKKTPMAVKFMAAAAIVYVVVKKPHIGLFRGIVPVM